MFLTQFDESMYQRKETKAQRFSGAEAGRRIKQRRNEICARSQDVAEFLGLSSNMFIRYEQNYWPEDHEKHGVKLAEALGVMPEWLITGDGPMESGKSPILKDENKYMVRISEEHRSMLGKRAADQRAKLGMSVVALREILQVPRSHLISREKRMKFEVEAEFEARWEDALSVPRGWLRSPEMDKKETVTVGSSIADELKLIGIWLSRKITIPKTYQFNELSDGEKKRLELFLCRYGYYGEEAALLQPPTSVEDQAKRIQMRKVSKDMVRSRMNAEFFTPKLDQLVEALKGETTTDLQALDSKYRSLLGDNLNVAAVDLFYTELYGMSCFLKHAA